ncbi:Putative MetA-pathway of phenol degradation [Duganella sp. CF402]|uniref:transporter n=1 Tax=unclassified Duganella TaxID=2636909 RepID=UPI0008BE2D66|nr:MULTISPECIES: transporter [unclassified Duganella]RZT04328.1 outer membrane putative beta-barrel porin/alpha-amylase [Duganella sp. BK701]SEM40201.1 Putative MetA-pathway of phenol degradation [Duganella sp. CF402]
MMLRTISLAVVIAFAAAPALAQQASQPATADAARDALAKKEGEGDQSALLKQTLTAVDKQYTLIRRNQLSVTYDFSYSYIGEDRIVTDIGNGSATLFNIENNNSHTVTNTFSADYGVRDNLTANVTLPLISRYADTAARSGMSNSIGDIGIGARWQPFEAKRDQPGLTVTSNVRLPTGRSPFKIIAGSGEATGSGVGAATVGLNVNKIVDPVALFGSVNFTASLPAKNLWQVNGSRILTRVAPGPSVGFGLGFAYALSYGISTTISFQEAISAGTKLRFADGLEAKTHMQTSGILNLGLGYRISPKTTVNFSVGIGLTPDSPNLIVGMNLPLSF